MCLSLLIVPVHNNVCRKRYNVRRMSHLLIVCTCLFGFLVTTVTSPYFTLAMYLDYISKVFSMIILVVFIGWFWLL